MQASLRIQNPCLLIGHSFVSSTRSLHYSEIPQTQTGNGTHYTKLIHT